MTKNHNIKLYFITLFIISILFLSYTSLTSNTTSLLSPATKTKSSTLNNQVSQPSPPPSPSPTPTATCKQISQYGITWTFSKDTPCSQFLQGRGDWYVIGPVTITSVSPAPSSGRHGSMTNPKGSNGGQAFDSRDSAGYDNKLSIQYPITLQPGTSLLSSISNPETTNCQIGSTNGWLTYNSRQCSFSKVNTVAILTVLSTAPPADAFRPSYAGTQKTIYTLSQVNKNLLLKLPPPSSIPSVTDLERYFERPWMMFIGAWYSRLSQPSNNAMDYSRDRSADVEQALLYLQLDVSNKDILLERVIQLGVDLEGVGLSGGYWAADGGHGNGNLAPMIITGHLLGNQKMKYPLSWMSAKPKENNFGEYCQTAFNSLNQPVWGIRYCQGNKTEWRDELNAYRTCCTSSVWPGQALALRLLGLKEISEHPAFDSYVQRWVNEGGGFSSNFVKDMWRMYHNYSPTQITIP